MTTTTFAAFEPGGPEDLFNLARGLVKVLIWGDVEMAWRAVDTLSRDEVTNLVGTLSGTMIGLLGSVANTRDPAILSLLWMALTEPNDPGFDL